MLTCLVVALLLSLLVIVTMLFERRREQKTRRRIEASYSTRTPLGDEAFYDRFYRGTTIPLKIVASIRQTIAEAFGLPLLRLHPDDQWDKLVNPSSLEGDFAEFFDHLAKQVGVRILDTDIVTLQNLTLREITAMVSRVLQRQANSMLK